MVEARGFVAGSGPVPDDAREVDALLGAEIKPPAKVWRKLQAQLRRDGIIH